MKKRLRELEAYQLPEPPLPPAVSGTPDQKEGEKEEHTESLIVSRLAAHIFSTIKKTPGRRILRPVIFLGLAIVIGGGIYFSYGKIKSWINPPAKITAETKETPAKKPAPEVKKMPTKAAASKAPPPKPKPEKSKSKKKPKSKSKKKTD